MLQLIFSQAWKWQSIFWGVSATNKDWLISTNTKCRMWRTGSLQSQWVIGFFILRNKFFFHRQSVLGFSPPFQGGFFYGFIYWPMEISNDALLLQHETVVAENTLSLSPSFPLPGCFFTMFNLHKNCTTIGWKDRSWPKCRHTLSRRCSSFARRIHRL